MKLFIVGATGRTGSLVVEQALDRGHEVTAFTRRPDAVLLRHPHLRVASGDGLSVDDLSQVSGHDAVLSIVAAPDLKRTTLAEQVARNLVKAMGRAGIARLVVTSSHALVATRPKPALALVRVLLRHSYADARNMESVLRHSDLDWRIVRANRLVDKPALGSVLRMPDGRDFTGGLNELTRADLASTLLDVVADDALVRRAIEVTGAGAA
ncbi:NAD(P)-dependent oxidoreductase [Acidipropionibacterium virtanenii]|uniref:3 beta-hydroxysteroid dehydrogenase/Delta 5-->4-isomerase n=1 Tax=Acidipropionibacterium virtanenii TaxID=2057246 RepID=A0A344URY9_9ACTN|nr:NAD(P)-binding oxidoreductase [Acidipropionibacterium virtanenii]AXE38037.1 3 beta-hydroxysteroid dehydrogenase/Delta 5-->4-isomerase [Acidipropionibacterium virtanenii]